MVTLVVGASLNPLRYSNKAAVSLLKHKHRILLFGAKEGLLEGELIHRSWPEEADIDTITLYLSAANQVGLYDKILALKPRRIIFNPGTENPELAEMARRSGIEAFEACTLVLLATGQY